MIEKYGIIQQKFVNYHGLGQCYFTCIICLNQMVDLHPNWLERQLVLESK